jgi:hypothetical protein
MLIELAFSQNEGQAHDITKSLEDVDNIKGKPAVVLREQDIHSFLCATFAFDQGEGKVGEPCKAQLSVTSYASKDSAPVSMTDIKIFFEGAIKPVTIRHDGDRPDIEVRPDGTLFSIIPLREEHSMPGGTSTPSTPTKRSSRPNTLVGKGYLIFQPGKTRVFEFTCPLREPGKAKALSATFAMAAPSFDLDYIIEFDKIATPEIWWIQKPIRKRIVRIDPHSIVILPKPPKMDIRFLSLKEQYYTDETISLELDIFNGEDEESIANLEIEIANDLPGNPPLPFKVHIPSAPQLDIESPAEGDTPAHTQLGRVPSSGSIVATLELDPVHLQATYEITLHLKYNLSSDLDTPISRTSAIRLNIGSPFEANYDFSPRLDSRTWPSFFDPNADENSSSCETDAFGLPQKWCLTAHYCSFAQEILVVEDINLSILALNGGVTCTTNRTLTDTNVALPIEPQALAESHFDVLTQKLSLDDRRSASLDLSLQITWRRELPGSPSNTSTLAIPRLLIASSEPRVLASVTYCPPTSAPYILDLSYMIENPSMHFLTFSVVMEPSDKFAFSGTKASTVQLLPLSRRKVELKVLPNVRGDWINPRLVVTDRYFQKVLKVQPGEGMKGEKEGVGVWVPPDDDDEHE